MIIISVIIPCYEAEGYVSRCLDSLLNQTIEKNLFEVICIDDGSKDDTYSVLCRYKDEHRDLNIEIIRFETNQGPSTARNAGIRHANGIYLNFLDIDDVQASDSYEKLLEPIKKREYDIVIGKHIRKTISESIIKNSKSERKDQEYSFEQNNGYYWPQFVFVGNNGDFFTLGAALILKRVLVENNVFFPEKYRINEDDYFFSVLQLYISNAYIVDWIIHIYIINSNSLMTTGSERLLDRIPLYESLLGEYKIRGIYEVLYDKMVNYFLHRYVLSSFYVFLMRMDKVPDIAVFRYILDFYWENFPDWPEKYNPREISEEDDYICRKFIMLDKLGRTIDQGFIEEIKEKYDI